MDNGRTPGARLPSLGTMRSAPAREHLARLRASARRTLLRRRRSLSALCAGLAVLAGLHTVAPPPPETVAVLTAARDLPSGSRLGPDDLGVVRVPPGAAPDGLLARGQAVGRTLAAPVRRGEAVTDVRLVGASLVEGYPGTVAVPVRIPDAGAVALLRVGDRIDVVASGTGDDGPGRTVAHRAPVVALPAAEEPGSLAAGAGTSGRLVVLAVPRDEAEDLAGHAVRGFLSITLSG